ncbi:MAG: RHS repeat-associated core domain-containing protein, partial [Akkermansia sp.]
MITSCTSKKLRNRSKRRFGCLGENTIRNNCVAYNPRSELTGATLGITPYVYNYDNIANRETAQEATDAVTAYEPIATRPISIRKNGTWYTYVHDLTKNVTELYNSDGTTATTYDYTPFGLPTQQGTDQQRTTLNRHRLSFGLPTQQGTDQPFQWSSEVYDAELGMVYYNYRHYNPVDGRWISRDIIELIDLSEIIKTSNDDPIKNYYNFNKNSQPYTVDNLGLFSWIPNINPKTKKPAHPPRELNTIVCDGKGGIEVQIGSKNRYQDQKCCVNCMREHEEFHIADV